MVTKRKKFLGIIFGVLILGAAVPSYAEKIVLEGSTTVLPLAQRAAEVYMENNPDANISVRGGGSGVGISSLLDGTCHIANSSREIKDSELRKAAINGVDPRGHVVAMDGIAIIVHPSNKVSMLSKKQIKEVYTGKISNWSQLGGEDRKIVVVSRDTSSGTFEAFRTMALDNAKVRPDSLVQASNQAVASTIAGTPNGIGYVGLGFLSPSIKVIEYEGVVPSKRTVVSKKYPLSRPLFMFTNGQPKGLAMEFLEFVSSPAGQKLAEAQGFVSVK